MKEFVKNNKSLLLAALAGFAGAVLLFLMGHHPNDDAYITFRHARNFAQTGLLSWNTVPPYEMGSTSPLLAFILGILGFISGPENIPQVSLIFNGFLMVVFGVILFQNLRLIIEQDWAVLLIVLTVSVNSYNIRIYTQGFEAALFTVIIFAGVFYAVTSKEIPAAMLAGLSLLVRPEGVYLIAVTFTVLLFQRKLTRKYAAVLIFPVIYAVFAYLMYGQILPQSVAAKQAYQELGMSAHSSFAANGQELNRFFVLLGLWDILLKPVLLMNSEAGIKLLDLPRMPGNFLFSGGNTVLIAMLFFTAYFAWKDFRQKQLRHLALIGYVYFLFVFLLIVKQTEFWYIPVWNTSALILLMAGSYLVLKDICTRLVKNESRRFSVIALIFSVISLLMVGKTAFYLNEGKRPYDDLRGIIYSPGWRDFDEFERYLGYKYSAEKLNQENPDGILMTNEVGILGYYYKGSIVDTFGLCSRDVISFYKKEKAEGRRGNSLEKLAHHFKPDYIVQGISEENLFLVLQEGYKTDEITKFRVFQSPLTILSKKSD